MSGIDPRKRHQWNRIETRQAMQPYLVMICVAFMVFGGSIAVIGRTIRRRELFQIFAGYDPPRRGVKVMLLGALFFVPAAVLLILLVKYF